MNKTMQIFIPACLGAAMVLTSCADAQKEVPATMKNTNDSLSYAIGVGIGENFKKNGLTEVDYELLIKGLKSQIAGTNEWEVQLANGFVQGELKKFTAAKAEKDKKSGEDFLAANKTKSGVITTASGLQYTVAKEGTGISPDNNDKVTVWYQGTLVDGTPFDGNIGKEQPSEFSANQVIPGWTEGLALMKEGGKMTFYIPQELAWGARSPNPKIPAFSMVIFEVELLKVQKVD